jgi:hypothetical protein
MSITNKFNKNLTKITGPIHEERCTFTSRSIGVRARNISEKKIVEKSKQSSNSLTFFQKSCRFKDNLEKYGSRLGNR